MYNPIKPYKKEIFELIRKTWNTPFVNIKKDVYSIIEKNFQYPEVDHTDGIGTKGFYHWQQRSFKNAVLDALAMNLNDMALMRATSYKLQNHILIPKEDEQAILEIIKNLSLECQKRNIAITGGETSIHNNMDGLDISIGLSGFIEKYKENKFQVGNVLLGIKSSGLHSNGFTKVREVFKDEYRAEFVEPTKIYIDEILNLNKRFDIYGMMHITGGAYTKLKDLLSDVDAVITNSHSLKPHNIFHELYKRGVNDEEMYKTFNCGIGFIFSSSLQDAQIIISEFKDMDIIGSVVAGMGQVKIRSAFSKQEIIF